MCFFFFFPEEQPKEEEEAEEEPLTGKDEEERRIAEMGRPMLGDHVKLEVIIEESYEFKVRQPYVSHVSTAGTFQSQGRSKCASTAEKPLNQAPKKTLCSFGSILYIFN